jgi:hypothetical protein
MGMAHGIFQHDDGTKNNIIQVAQHSANFAGILVGKQGQLVAHLDCKDRVSGFASASEHRLA